jgi:TrpR-related protein YerC/YecD
MTEFKFNKQTDRLFEAILALKTTKEAEDFFRDLCTVDELREISDRWQIVDLLQQGKPYREIAKKVQASTTTVSRVAYWLNYGQGGYQKMYDRVKSHHGNSAPQGKGLRSYLV